MWKPGQFTCAWGHSLMEPGGSSRNQLLPQPLGWREGLAWAIALSVTLSGYSCGQLWVRWTDCRSWLRIGQNRSLHCWTGFQLGSVIGSEQATSVNLTLYILYIYITDIYIYIHTYIYIYIVHTVHVVKLEYKWTDQRNPSDSAMAPERSLSSMSMKVFLTMNPRSWMSPNGQGTWIERWNKKLWNALTISLIQNSAKRKRLPKNWNAAELDFIGDVTFVLVLGNTSSTFVQSATSFCGSYKMDWRQHITLMYIII